ncbi:hypothetical protein A1Q1_00559 [Trichosporon asahii var. asahii CBS 2479]|uniref:Uncharacterized protein n=1 Tax=Trichosporon asahii var. asahii (strain ATCC 90039 / CBS 2479 / JCM 2466 / KCTC 7840 / NBRC 103889/ NCYC 2677 / UAMH 7654) TaxID=1186058 RepID=J6F4C2_TRIAS|nr:hypothetical protein A1Q1_00559 [Trichosporon asahii var. asahii CBS 2479]EJT50092.1 hypothetical protein A1Q1_00559 [Trichosporon asahii var. asahii CBS 2479]
MFCTELAAEQFPFPAPAGTRFCEKEVPSHSETTPLYTTEPDGRPEVLVAECVFTGCKSWMSFLPGCSDMHKQCVYVSFQYLEFDFAFREAVCTRNDLISAFNTLLSDRKALEDALIATRMVLSGLEVMPGTQQASKAKILHEKNAQIHFRERLRILRCQCEEAFRRLDNGIHNFGQYLYFLSLCEDYGIPQLGWSCWGGWLSEENVRFPEKREHMFRNGWMCDDYAFRAAKVINASETPEEVKQLHVDLDGLTREYLAFKGYALTPTAAVMHRPPTPHGADDLPPPYAV